MDTISALTRFEAALTGQLALTGGDPAVESAGRALLAALAPAARQLALELVDQAAAEVAAQLPDHQVEVVMREGDPALSIRGAPGTGEVPPDEDYEARITLRLPPSLKALVEEAAGVAGDSVNAFVVKRLSRIASRHGGHPGHAGHAGRRVQGTVQT